MRGCKFPIPLVGVVVGRQLYVSSRKLPVSDHYVMEQECLQRQNRPFSKEGPVSGDEVYTCTSAHMLVS